MFVEDCEVDDTTTFENCAFDGTLELSGVGRGHWRAVRRDACRYSTTAQIAFGGILQTGELNDAAAVEKVLELALSRFWKAGRLKRSMRRIDWRRGLLGRHDLCEPVLKVLLREGVLCEIPVSGVQEGGIAIVDAAIGDVQRFMDNRQLSGRLARAKNTLSKAV